MAKQKKALFFVNGDVPTEAEVAAMDSLSGFQVCARNAHHVPKEGALEEADAVSGTVPKRYADAYEHVGTVEVLEDEAEEATEAGTDAAPAAWGKAKPAAKPKK